MKTLLKTGTCALLPCLTLTLAGIEAPKPPREVSQASLMRMASELSAPAMKGRLTGAESGRIAEAWVEKAMRSLPLEVKTQEVSFPLYEVLSPTALALIDAQGAPLNAFHYISDFREVQFSGTGDITGELVFAGFGTDAPGFAPYAEVDVKGRIAVILWGLPKGAPALQGRLDVKLDNAHRHGAKGVIVIPTGGLAKHMEEKGDEAILQALDTKRELHPELLHEDLPAVFVRKAAAEALLGRPVEEVLKSPAAARLGRSAHLQLKARVHREARSRNVIGILKGQDPELAREVILLGAHYDHLGMGADGRIFPGASDNAAGTAVLLEAARVLTQSGLRPRRTIAFALWCAEEQGLYGSRFYAEQAPLLPLQDTKLMIQLDYLGEKEGPGLSNVNANPLVQLFAGKPIKEGLLQVIDWGGRGASDDVPFSAKGIPAYRFIAYGDHHHRDSDTATHLNPEMLKKTADIVVNGLKAVAF